MDDLISRQNAIRWVKTECNPYGKPSLDYESGAKVIDHLEKMPSAQKKGHWVENQDSDHAWKCSECGCGYTDNKLSFCYDCGADMRGDAGNG